MCMVSIALYTLSLLFCKFINTTDYHFGRYDHSPHSIEELHGCTLIVELLAKTVITSGPFNEHRFILPVLANYCQNGLINLFYSATSLMSPWSAMTTITFNATRSSISRWSCLSSALLLPWSAYSCWFFILSLFICQSILYRQRPRSRYRSCLRLLLSADLNSVISLGWTSYLRITVFYLVKYLIIEVLV